MENSQQGLRRGSRSVIFTVGVMITYRLEKKASGLNMPSWSPSSLKAGHNLTLLITPYWGRGGGRGHFQLSSRLNADYPPSSSPSSARVVLCGAGACMIVLRWT